MPASASGRLSNLAQLDFLRTSVNTSDGTLHSQGKPSRVAVQPGEFTVVLG